MSHSCQELINGPRTFMKSGTPRYLKSQAVSSSILLQSICPNSDNWSWLKHNCLLVVVVRGGRLCQSSQIGCGQGENQLHCFDLCRLFTTGCNLHICVQVVKCCFDTQFLSTATESRKSDLTSDSINQHTSQSSNSS